MKRQFKLVDGVKGQPPLRLYQSRFELRREAQARGREEFIGWYCDSEALLRSADRLRPILDRSSPLTGNAIKLSRALAQMPAQSAVTSC